MKIFYGNAIGKPNVPHDMPIEFNFDQAIHIFRRLDQKSGFMGLVLGTSHTLQLMSSKGTFRIEIVNHSKPAIDSVERIDFETAEKILGLAFENIDVVNCIYDLFPDWKHLDLPRKQ